MGRHAERFILVALLVSCAGGAPIVEVTVEGASPAIRGAQLAEPVGLETLGGVFTPLLEPGALPRETTEIFSTAADNQPEISLHLFRGHKSVAAQNHALGTFVIGGLPPRPRGVPQVEVTLRADAHDIVLVVRDRGRARLSVKRALP